jgi:hypothetical protein
MIPKSRARFWRSRHKFGVNTAEAKAAQRVGQETSEALPHFGESLALNGQTNLARYGAAAHVQSSSA